MWANAAAILSLSLAPVRHDEPVPLTCLICGWEGASDFILNLGFYLPLGVALWCALRRPGRAVALALLLSAAVELAQLVIPGRDSTLGDLVANTLGAAAGVALARHAAAWAAPSPRAAGWMSLGAALAALGVIALTGVAAAPAFPRAPLRAEWAARTESLARYHGRVL
ncbi:MAG TPA: VanZ family protein, partial [Longimicrobium sp.]|nr:VanZ family protein [Longimicrobium sp.]